VEEISSLGGKAGLRELKILRLPADLAYTIGVIMAESIG
jgi:hypothetical protein